MMTMRLASLAIFLLAFTGCSMNEVYMAPLASIHQSVLFDPHPNPRFADLGNVRNQWPTSDAYFADPENLSYSERIYDIQGNNFYNNNFPIRRFQMIREGSAIR